MNIHQKKRNRLTRHWLTLETLESRQLLDATGLIWGSSPYLTLSFAPDGTAVAGQTNSLFQAFDKLAPRDQWQNAIVTAVQRWAVHTNADVGVVPDQGQPFGSPGASFQDSRFGDIRVGAIRLAPDIAAVSIPHNEAVAGTWVGDILFNTGFEYSSVDDLVAVAMHEAGHVFGLEHSADQSSVMYVHGNSGDRLSPSDELAIQSLYGRRAPDLNEGDQGNSSFDRATDMELEDEDGLPVGYVPAVVYGDRTSHDDIDTFELPIHDYVGPVTVRLKTAHLSQLLPKLEIYDADEVLIHAAAADADYDGELHYTIPNTGQHSRYFIRVQSESTDEMGIGGYVLTATYDDRLQVEQQFIDEISNGRYRFLDQDTLQKFFEPGKFEVPDFDAEIEDNDERKLEIFPGLDSSTRFVTQSTIAAPGDIDTWDIPSPPKSDGSSWVMTVQARTLVPGQLIPRLEVKTVNGQTILAEVLVNGGGSVIVQASDVPANEMLRVVVSAADPWGLFQTGNYELTVSFGPTASALRPVAQAALTQDSPTNAHTLYVAKDQFVHLALDTTAGPAPSTSMVRMTLQAAETGQEMFRIAARAGQVRTGPTIRLAAGTYTIQTELTDVISGGDTAIDYQIKSVSVDGPLSVPVDDPAADPLFQCGQNAGMFCYPNGGVTPDPILWTQYTGPPLGTTTPAPGQTMSTFVADWWQWLSETTPNTTEGVVAGFERYFVNHGEALNVSAADGVLSNDSSAATRAVVIQPPDHGQLEWNADGSFIYTPDPGFIGKDSVGYIAVDQLIASDLVSVPLHVTPGLPGDANLDGSVDATDFGFWNQNRYTGPGKTWNEGDFTQDGYVDGSDFNVWFEHKFAAAPAAEAASTGSDAAIPKSPLSGGVHSRPLRDWRRNASLALQRGRAPSPITSSTWPPRLARANRRFISHNLTTRPMPTSMNFAFEKATDIVMASGLWI